LTDLACCLGAAFAGVAALRGCCCAAGLFEVLLEGVAGLRLGALDFLASVACLDLAAGVRAVLAAAAADVFALAALRTGAFSAAERFGFGWGCAALTLTLRLAEDFVEALLGAGREVFLFAPLITGSLMRSTQVFTDSPRKGPPQTPPH
jgi:hypothetical protein